MTDKEWHDQLRAPFPKETVGTLPKPYSKDAKKGNCKECDGYHGLPAVHLDYVGHAAVTDRLLTIDPEWTWEPLALDQMGLPALDREGNLWIKLTIHGHTRLGVGDGRSMKERIGDAIRNAAMRFGVALDLWSKDELESAGSFEAQAPAHVSNPPRAADQFTAPALPEDEQQAWLDSVEAVQDVDKLRALYEDAKAKGVLQAVPGLTRAVTARKKALEAE